ncbi:hypothetical protein [Paracoccus sp. ME4]|uniref:hypothetical protein n=1 Tax=Paracoccus sp. ME4 TaxID=3138066 RepID=UPI00398B6DC9
MGTMVAGAPLLAGGPPGWVAYGLLGLGTLAAGYLIYENTQSNAITVPTTGTQTDTARRSCDRPWSVRIHAQGNVIGGRGGATLGAPPIVRPTSPVIVVEGLGLSAATFAMLSRGQARTLSSAHAQANTWISRRPPGGYLGQKSFYGTGGQRGNDRFDVDSYGCSPNFIT